MREESPILTVKNLKKIYGEGCEKCSGKGENLIKNFCPSCHTVYACNDISFNLYKGETLGVVGESGSGDSDIMMTDTINPLKSKFKGFHKTFKQDDLGLSLSSFLLN